MSIPSLESPENKSLTKVEPWVVINPAGIRKPPRVPTKAKDTIAPAALNDIELQLPPSVPPASTPLEKVSLPETTKPRHLLDDVTSSPPADGSPPVRVDIMPPQNSKRQHSLSPRGMAPCLLGVIAWPSRCLHGCLRALGFKETKSHV